MVIVRYRTICRSADLQKIFYFFQKSVDILTGICYYIVTGRETPKGKGITKMTTWYTVNRGAITLEQIFNTREEAELMALAMTIANGETWNAETVIGWDR